MLGTNENLTLLSVFDTEFLQNALRNIASDVPDLSLILHVGPRGSWPLELEQGKYAAMIFNTHYQKQPGEHWIAVFVDGSTQSAYTFDSLPVRPFPQEVMHKLSKICNNVQDINPQRFLLQSPDYPLCGIYCLAFLERFAKEKPLLLCPQNQLLNDVNVLEYVLPFVK